MEDVKTVQDVLNEVESRMNKSVEAVKKDFSSLRTGRANVAIVEGITVDYYGTSTPIKNLANLSIPDPKTVLIQPWDAGALGEIEKGIQKSDLGLNPIVDGKVIRISVPQLTDERRNELSKLIKKVAEEGKISLRAARHEGIDACKKLESAKEITEDDLFDSQKDIQKVTDQFVKDVESLLEQKEKDIREI